METLKTKGSTIIKYQPATRYVVVSAKSEMEKKLNASSLGLILSSDLSDKEKIAYGGTNKSADVANKAGEEQEIYELLAVGSDSYPYKIGDMVLFRPGCQPTAIVVEDKYYLQLGIFEILGVML